MGVSRSILEGSLPSAHRLSLFRIYLFLIWKQCKAMLGMQVGTAVIRSKSPTAKCPGHAGARGTGAGCNDAESLGMSFKSSFSTKK